MDTYSSITSFIKNFENFVKKNRDCYYVVVPHKVADVDALCASILIYDILRRMGVNYVGLYAPKMNAQSKMLLEKYPFPVSTTLPSTTQKIYYVLVDVGSEDKIPVLDDGEVIAIIDHHINNPLEHKIPFSLILPASSTTFIVYSIYEIMFKEVPKPLAPYVIAGMLADTGFLRYATKEDFNLIYKLINLYGFSLKEFSFLYKSFEDVDKEIKIKALKRAEYVDINGYHVVISFIGSEEGKIANMFVQLGFEVACVVNLKHQRISIRLGDKLKHITHRFMEILQNNNVVCGGHEGVIGCRFKDDKRIKDVVVNALKDVLRDV